MAEAYRVFVVLDREYDERLLELARSGPVWIVDTPQNRVVAQNLWGRQSESQSSRGCYHVQGWPGLFKRRDSYQRARHNRPSSRELFSRSAVHGS